MQETIRVLEVRPGKRPELIEIENSLEGLQNAVGGYIETVPEPGLPEDCVIICDEEGKLKGKPCNRALWDIDGDICDVICGTFLIAATNGDELRDMTDEEIVDAMSLHLWPERFDNTKGVVRMIRGEGNREC